MDNISETILSENIEISDITQETKCMPEGGTFISLDNNGQVIPNFAREISSVYLLMHWELLRKDKNSSNKSEHLDPDYQAAGMSANGLSLYAVLMKHGKTYVAEIFFQDEYSGQYLGSSHVFSIKFPQNLYSDQYDEWLMEELASKTLGVHREKILAHNLVR